MNRSSSSSPASSALSRRWGALRYPGRTRRNALRRVLALLLLFAAVVNWAQSRREHPEAVVFAESVAAGQPLDASHLELRRVPRELLPAGAMSSLEDPRIAGAILLSAAGPGELLTETRILPVELSTAGIVSDSTANSSAVPLHIVPVKLADPAMASHVHHGDIVSLIANAPSDPADGPFTDTPPDHSSPQSTVIAAGAHVMSPAPQPASEAHVGGPSSGRLGGSILVALPADAAAAVAAASLQQPLAIVITGPRASGTSADASTISPQV